MSMKKIFSVLFFILLFIFNNQKINTQPPKAKLMSVTNQTSYVLFAEEVEVTPEKTLSTAPLPRQIPSTLPGITISGVGKDIKPFFSGQLIILPPLLGQGWAWLDEEYPRGAVTVVFQAKGEADLRISFGDKFTTKPIYTFVIGGDGNTRSSILKNGIEMTHVTREQNPDAMISIIRGQEAGAYIPFYVSILRVEIGGKESLFFFSR